MIIITNKRLIISLIVVLLLPFFHLKLSAQEELIIDNKLYSLTLIGANRSESNLSEILGGVRTINLTIYYTKDLYEKYLVFKSPPNISLYFFIGNNYLVFENSSILEIKYSIKSSDYYFFKLSDYNIQKIKSTRIKSIKFNDQYSNNLYSINISEELGYKIMSQFNDRILDSNSPTTIVHTAGEVISASDKFIIKMNKSASGVWKIPAILNGSVKTFLLFDTGASDVALPSDIVMTLFRSETLKETDIIGKETYTLANGSIIECKYFFLKELTLGDITLKNVKTVILENIMADPILGQNVISKIGTYKINTAEGIIEIQKK